MLYECQKLDMFRTHQLKVINTHVTLVQEDFKSDKMSFLQVHDCQILFAPIQSMPLGYGLIPLT